jgi:twitching motility protein PilT
MQDYKKLLHRILEIAIKEQASDIHFSPGQSPILRIFGILFPLVKEKTITPEDSKNLAFFMMNEAQREKFLKEKDLDFSYDFEGRARFRVNAFFQMGQVSIAMRLIPSKIKTIEELNLPHILHRFTKAQQGFVLVCGPASHGKSTTLASLIDEINHTRAEHIITIEDPIEYVFEDDRSIIDQREVGRRCLEFCESFKISFKRRSRCYYGW